MRTVRFGLPLRTGLPVSTCGGRAKLRPSRHRPACLPNCFHQALGSANGRASSAGSARPALARRPGPARAAACSPARRRRTRARPSSRRSRRRPGSAPGGCARGSACSCRVIASKSTGPSPRSVTASCTYAANVGGVHVLPAGAGPVQPGHRAVLRVGGVQADQRAAHRSAVTPVQRADRADVLQRQPGALVQGQAGGGHGSLRSFAACGPPGRRRPAARSARPGPSPRPSRRPPQATSSVRLPRLPPYQAATSSAMPAKTEKMPAPRTLLCTREIARKKWWKTNGT